MNLICIIPPYRHRHCPPAGASALLGHLKDVGIEAEFLDLRPYTPDVIAPTYSPIGVFGESYVIDIPDLPLVLFALRAHQDRIPFESTLECRLFEDYCAARGIRSKWLRGWLVDLESMVADALDAIPNIGVIGFSVWSSNLLSTLLAASHLKRRGRPPVVIAGGPQVTESRASALLGLRSGLFDAVVHGEGEHAFAQVIHRCSNGLALEGIPRVWTSSAPPQLSGGVLALPSHNRAVTRVKEPGEMLPMERLPLPDFSRMDLAAYRDRHGRMRLPYQLSRGCTDRCTFCSEWVFWERFRAADVGHCLDDLQQLQALWGADQFHFTDSLINGHMRHLRQFAESIVERQIEIDWGGFMRASMDQPTADLLRRSGFSYAYIGVESLSDETLALMNKRRTRADNLAAIDSFLASAIRVSAGVIPGFPGDDRHRFMATVRELIALRERHPEMFSFNVEPFVLSPGQPISHRLDDVGLKTTPWSEEVLDIVPTYSEITRSIPCTVEGANQGLERLGQLRTLELLSGSGSSLASPDGEEDLPSHRARLIWDRHAVLVQIKLRGRLTGVLAAPEEAHDLRTLIERAGTSTFLMHDRRFEEAWARLVRAQAWPPLRRILPARSARTLGSNDLLWLAPYVVGRLFDEHLVISNMITERFVYLDAAWWPVCRHLCAAPTSCAEILGRYGDHYGLSELMELHASGLIQIVAPTAHIIELGGNQPVEA